jgi:hypothetical protein
MKDIRDFRAQMPTPAFDDIYGEVEMRKKFDDTLAVVTATVAGNDAFGARGRLEAGLAKGPVAASVGVEGRLNDRAAPFQNGWKRRVTGTVVVAPDPKVRVDLNGAIGVEKGPLDVQGGLGLQTKFR